MPASATSVRLFEPKRFGDHRDRQDLEFARDLRYDRRSTCTGTAAHARGDEHHVRTRKHFGNSIAILERRLSADLRVRTGTKSLRERSTDLQRGFCVEALQCLRIRVRRNEVHAFYAPAQHVLNGVAATTTDTNHFDDRALRPAIDEFKHFSYS